MPFLYPKQAFICQITGTQKYDRGLVMSEKCNEVHRLGRVWNDVN